MTVSTIKMNARQFEQLGEDPAGVRLELVDGEISVSPSPNPRHSMIVLELAAILKAYIRQNDSGILLADVDTVFGAYDVRRPDLLFFSKPHAHFVTDKKLLALPDLAIEVTSPSSGTVDRHDKFTQYAAGGVSFYWIVDPDDQTLEVFELVNGAYQLQTRGTATENVQAKPFPNLTLHLAQLWTSLGM
jgi:Uma2 family endonuclease